MKKKVLTIVRRWWRRGEHGAGIPALPNNHGFMCCLGFEALACGLRREDIEGLAKALGWDEVRFVDEDPDAAPPPSPPNAFNAAKGGMKL